MRVARFVGVSSLVIVLAQALACASAPSPIDIPGSPAAPAPAKADASSPQPAPDAGTAAPRDAGAPDAPDTRAVAEARIDAMAARAMAASHRAGVAVAVLKRGAVTFARGYGQADLAAQKPVTPDTLFMVASVSKPVVAVALMHLVEQGRVGLDDDVSTVLPFPVRNPGFPAAKITPRMVLTHTSTVVNNYERLAYSFVPTPGVPLPALRAVLQDFLVPGGSTYDATKNFLTAAPGAAYEYSGIASSISALLVESAAHSSFEAYCADHVLRPLGMARSAWHLADVPRAELALPYAWNAATGVNEPIPPYELSAYPAATFRTSARELARFLLAFMNDGELDGVRILKRETVAEMKRVQLADALEPGQGLIWYYVTRDGRRLLGHSGSFDGYRSEMFYQVGTDVGVVLLSNGDNDEPEDPLRALQRQIFAVAADL